MNATPLLVVVTGPPASGKTTLAETLAGELALPLVAKDAIKERLYDEVGIGDRAWSQRLGRGTFAVMFHWLAEELRAGRSLIVEANFSEEALPAFAALPPHRTLQVYCTAPRDVLLERYAQRPRHPGHVDDVVLEELRGGFHDDRHPRLPLGGEVLDVDSSTPIDVPAVVERVRASLRRDTFLGNA